MMSKKIYQPARIDLQGFFSVSSPHRRIEFLLQLAALAPSTHNTQPWRLKISDNACELYIDNNRQLPAADPLKRDMYISLGAFLHNLESAATAYNVLDNIELTDQTTDLV